MKKQVKVTPEEFLEGYRYIEEAMNQSDSYEDALHHILKYFDRKLNGHIQCNYDCGREERIFSGVYF